MAQTTGVVYENGVFKPLRRPDFSEHAHLLVTVQTTDDLVDELFPPSERIDLDSELARAIVEDPEFSLWGR